MVGISLPLEYPILEHDDTVRLFQLYVGDGEGELEGQFVMTRLSEALDYSAISYTRGTDETKEAIVIDGRNSKINQNLAFCLYALRSQAFRNPSRFPGRLLIWCDDVCINKDNIYEKSYHVQRMGKVYQAAKSVIAYIGTFTAGLGLFLLDSRSDAKPRRQDQIRLLVELGEAEYWTRTWIVTECLNAKKFYLLSDTDVISDKVIYQALDYYISGQVSKSRFDISSGTIPDFSKTTMWKLLSMRKTREWDRDLLPLMKSFEEQKCYLAHDKVYALVGLEVPESNLVVDYSKNLVQIYYEVLTIYEGSTDWNYVEAVRKALDLSPSDLVLKANLPEVRSLHMQAKFNFICRIGDEQQLKAPSASVVSYFKSASKWSLTLPDHNSTMRKYNFYMISGEVETGDIVVGFHGQTPILVLRGDERFQVVGVADVAMQAADPKGTKVARERRSAGADEQINVDSFAQVSVSWDDFRLNETIKVDQPTWLDLYWRAVARPDSHKLMQNPRVPPKP